VTHVCACPKPGHLIPFTVTMVTHVCVCPKPGLFVFGEYS
jgi:hypothetical protein